MTSPSKNTEELILEAACTVFIMKGYSGARMQEIADAAGINKSLLHYYYRSKDKLFDSVFTQAIQSFLSNIKRIIEEDLPLELKIIRIVETYIDMLIKNPHIPAIVIQELNTHPGRFVEKLLNFGIDPNLIIEQVEKEVEMRNIRPVKSEHFIVNLLAMCIFPFVARPVIKGILKKNDDEYQRFLEERKEQIIQFIMNSMFIA